MYGLFDDPPRLPDHRVLVWIAPMTTQPRQVDAEPLRISMLGQYAEGWLAHEQWRIGAKPELYHDWQLDLHDECLPAGVYTLPCDRCKTTHTSPDFNTPCPTCGE